MNEPELSIVIPALNEEHKIREDVRASSRFLEEAGMTGEVIVVDDGSMDATADVAERTPTGEGIESRVLRLHRNYGKGRAVRVGIGASRGRYVMFMDSGLCVPLHYILDGLRLLEQNECDIAHGSRHLPESIVSPPRPLHRRILSFVFRRFFYPLLGMPSAITDSQCGFKIYPGNVGRELYRRCKTDGAVFDAEVIMRATRRGLRIREFPVEWTGDPDSRLQLGREMLRAPIELVEAYRAARPDGD